MTGKVFLNINFQDKCGFREARVVFYSEVKQTIIIIASVNFSTSGNIVGLKICLPDQTNTRLTSTRFPSPLLLSHE